MKTRVLAVMAVLLSTPLAAQDSSSAITAAITNPSRPQADMARDALRHPEDLVAFAGLKPGNAVMDIWPGSGYWTRIFSDVVGPKGKVVAFVPAETAAMKSDPLNVAKAFAKEAGRANVEVVSRPLSAQAPEATDNTFDVCWTFENYHDLHDSFMKGADVNAFNKVIYKLLKPGAYYVIGDYAATAGSGLKNREDLHRIDPAAAKAEVEKAGFVFDGELKVLNNPGDDHSLKSSDPSIRDKIDRFVFRFKKPN